MKYQPHENWKEFINEIKKQSYGWISPIGQLFNLEYRQSHSMFADSYISRTGIDVGNVHPMEWMIESGWVRVGNPYEYEGKSVQDVNERQIKQISNIIHDVINELTIDAANDKIFSFYKFSDASKVQAKGPKLFLELLERGYERQNYGQMAALREDKS